MLRRKTPKNNFGQRKASFSPCYISWRSFLFNGQRRELYQSSHLTARKQKRLFPQKKNYSFQMADVLRLAKGFVMAVIMSTYCMMFVLSWCVQCLEQFRVILHPNLLNTKHSFPASLKVCVVKNSDSGQLELKLRGIQLISKSSQFTREPLLLYFRIATWNYFYFFTN